MCALTPIFPSFGWPLGDLISHQQSSYIYEDTETIDSIPYFSPSQPAQVHHLLDRSASFTENSGDPTTVKKLYHNASERDRRKKINSLYSSLRSLLPAADQTKKLSIPATVSRVLKYIPELQQQVERLIQKKEELLSRISKQGNLIHNHQEKRRNKSVGGSFSSISANRLSDSEIAIQISTHKVHNSPLSGILFKLEEDGLLLMNASSFETYGGRVFYNLHLEVEKTYRLECEVLSDKLFMKLCEKREEMFP